ncbi:Phospholipase/carboxylesterase [Exidia glandulosa HHB12029]|uniref:Acyl-protein thioesterase 1 n=1 Tax=Exidia glandulosa HHB12029 TaxID=1314781 RepID=A0A165QXC7_EXIGL|nr:Phospholipase/carboxylesterase [Exidia glandulosa HHB12029]
MSTVPPPKFLTVEPRGTHTATVVFIHGLGDSGAGWQPVAQMLGRSDALAHVKWILPHAPNQPVTVNGGMRMPSWYDLYSLGDAESFKAERKEDEQGMLRSRDSILSLINKDIEAGIPQERIVVGGFSQGSVVSLLVALTGPLKLGGLVVASGYMPLASKIKEMATSHAVEIPVFWAHGKADPLIPFRVAESSLSLARAQLGFMNAAPGSTAGIEFHAYDGMGHSANDEEIVALGQWLARVVPKSG